MAHQERSSGSRGHITASTTTQARNVQGTKPPPLYLLGRSLSHLQLSIPTPLPSPWLLLLHTQMTLTALLGVLLSPVYFSTASYFSNMEVHLHFFLGTQHGTEVPHSYAGFVPVAFCHFLLCSSHTNDSLFDNDNIYSHMPIFTLLPPRLYCFSAILFPLWHTPTSLLQNLMQMSPFPPFTRWQIT